jgi:hypothetical protein
MGWTFSVVRDRHVKANLSKPVDRSSRMTSFTIDATKLESVAPVSARLCGPTHWQAGSRFEVWPTLVVGMRKAYRALCGPHVKRRGARVHT